MTIHLRRSHQEAIKSFYLQSRWRLLKAAGFFLPRRKKAFDLQAVKEILFIRIDRIGDMVLSTPAFRAIKEGLPHSRLTVLCTATNAPVLLHNPHVDEVIPYPSESLLKKYRTIKYLRNGRHFDLAVDPCPDYELKTALLAAASGAGHAIGHPAFGREILLDLSVPPINEHRHFLDATLDLLESIGVAGQGKKPEIFVSAEERKWAKQWLAANGLLSRTVLAVHPGAHYETQRWPAEYYAELIDLINRKTPAGIIILGGPSDAPVVERIMAGANADSHAFIQDDLRRSIALLSECKVLICNNSGPLHLAAALNIPTISFMGPTVKERWMPVGEIHRVFRRDDLSCIGCNLGYCRIKTHDCMRLIRPETVIEAILAQRC